MSSKRGALPPSSTEPTDEDEAYLRRLVGRLKEVRLARGMTLRDLEKATGIHNTHLSRSERGLSEAGIVVLRRWCRALDLSFERLCVEAAREKK